METMDVGIGTSGNDNTPPNGDSWNPGDSRIATVMGKRCKGKYCPARKKLTKEGSIDWQVQDGTLTIDAPNDYFNHTEAVWNELASGGLLCHRINNTPVDENFKLLEQCISFLTDNEIELQMKLPLHGGLTKVLSELKLNIPTIVDMYRYNFIDNLEYGTLDLYTTPKLTNEFHNTLEFLEPKLNYILEGNGDKINSKLWITLLEAYVNKKLTIPNIQTFLIESGILIDFTQLREGILIYLKENDIVPLSETYYVNLNSSRFIKESVIPDPKIVKHYKKIIILDNSMFLPDYSITNYSEPTINWIKSKNLPIYNNNGERIIL
jgi:hypothetical protein